MSAKIDLVKLKEEFKQRRYEVVKFKREGKYNMLYAYYICKKHKNEGIRRIRCSAFKQGQGCKSCANIIIKEKVSLGHNKFVERVKSRLKKDYTLLSEYTKANNKIKIKHNKCGKIYDIRAFNFYRGDECPYCQGRRKTTEEFRKELHDQVGDEYSIIGEYRGSHHKIKVKHNLCGREYLVTPNKFLIQTRRCPSCSGRNNSKLSLKIETFLYEYELYYKKEYRIKDCRDKLPLPFDFVIFNNDRKLFCLIEADGEQHFKVGKFHSKNLIKHDRMKDAYCKKNDINLVRIKDINEVDKILMIFLHDLIKDKKPKIDINSSFYVQQKMLKFKPAIVRGIRKDYISKDISTEKLAERYATTKYIVREILHYNIMPNVLRKLKNSIKAKILKRRGNRGPGTITWADEKTQQEIIKLYQNSDYSLRTIATKYNTTHGNISRLLKSNDIVINKRYNKGVIS